MRYPTATPNLRMLKNLRKLGSSALARINVLYEFVV